MFVNSLVNVVLVCLYLSCAYKTAAGGVDRKYHDRVIHDPPLSENGHVDVDGEHNADYDRDAFLGDEADDFEKLSEEEKKTRLAIIIDKIDKDHDGRITTDEMKNWIEYTQHKYINDDVNRQWDQQFDGNNGIGEVVGWESYRQRLYGFTDGSESNSQESLADSISEYRKMESKDHRRWLMADVNQDGFLTKDEFRNFLHPEEVHHMRDVVVQETLEDLDKNNDNKVSLEEYMGDMYGNDLDDQSEADPEWIKVEKEQFTQLRDTNEDGYLDKEEIGRWILPSETDHSQSEADHLLHESDANGDGVLSKDEILSNHQLFVGSQVTDFGDALLRHEEF